MGVEAGPWASRLGSADGNHGGGRGQERWRWLSCVGGATPGHSSAAEGRGKQECNGPTARPLFSDTERVELFTFANQSDISQRTSQPLLLLPLGGWGKNLGKRLQTFPSAFALVSHGGTLPTQSFTASGG